MGVNVVVSGGNINVGTGQPGSAAVSNSDDSYQATVAAGGSLELPDITITKNDDTTVTYPAAKDLDIGVIDPCVPSVPSGWAAMVAAYGRAYHYPQPSGREVSYRTGDEWDIETTIFAPARSAQAEKIFNTLTDFNTLKNTNSFGNTNRFTDSVGGQDYDGTGGSLDKYIVDNFTGLGWGFLPDFTLRNWNDSIDFGLTLSQSGFDDWFLPSIGQLISIFAGGTSFWRPNDGEWPSLNINQQVITSTTVGDATSNCYMMNATDSFNSVQLGKTSTRRVHYVRKHF